jgi:hypothetical protein
MQRFQELKRPPPYFVQWERYEELGEDPFIVPLDPSDARVASSALLYAKERCAAIIAELPPVAVGLRGDRSSGH